MFKLGETLQDTITGFTGVAVADVSYINGCRQFGLAPRIGPDGKASTTEYFDHQRLARVKKKPLPVAPSDTGGEQRDKPSASYRG